jgi:hypothetical protein
VSACGSQQLLDRLAETGDVAPDAVCSKTGQYLNDRPCAASHMQSSEIWFDIPSLSEPDQSGNRLAAGPSVSFRRQSEPGLGVPEVLTVAGPTALLTTCVLATGSSATAGDRVITNGWGCLSAGRHVAWQGFGPERPLHKQDNLAPDTKLSGWTSHVNRCERRGGDDDAFGVGTPVLVSGGYLLARPSDSIESQVRL